MIGVVNRRRWAVVVHSVTLIVLPVEREVVLGLELYSLIASK